MDFDHSAKAQDYIGRMQDFLDTRILPAEAEYEAELERIFVSLAKVNRSIRRGVQ